MASRGVARPEVDEPLAVRRDFLLEAIEGDVVPVADQVEAADLDRPQLRMIEAFPGDEAVAAQLLVAPAQELELVLDRVIAPEPGGCERVRRGRCRRPSADSRTR